MQRFSKVVQESLSLLNDIPSEIEQAKEDVKDQIYDEIAGSSQTGDFVTVQYNSQNKRNELKSKPLVSLLNIASNASELNAMKLEPVGMSTIFNSWYRFSHWRNEQNISGDSGHDMGGRMEDCPNNWSGWEHQTARNKWSYDPSTNMIRSNRNSPVYAAFINPYKLQNWYLKTQCFGGGDGDNDAICICCAFMTDTNGREHTIDLVRARSGVGNGIYLDQVQMRFYWSLVYDYNTDTEFELANNLSVYCAPIDQGWGNNYCCLEVKRTMNRLECWTSDVVPEAVTITDPNSKIDYILPETKPSNYSDEMYNNLKIMLESGAQMGVGAHSQNGLFTILDQKYIFEDTKLYDTVNNIIWEYNEKTATWSNVGRVSDVLTEGNLYFSQKTNKLMLYHNGGVITI